jgi:hypothetical protein
MKKVSNIITKSLVILFLCGASAYAVPSLSYIEQWGSAGGQGWVSDGDIASISSPSGALLINFNAQLGNPPFEGIVRTGGAAPSDNFVGDYLNTGVGSVQFNFSATAANPAALALYFKSTVSGNEWAYNLTPGSPSYTVGISTMGSWQGQNGLFDDADFLADITGISWIGLFLRQSGEGPSEYQLDDFHFLPMGGEGAVPEPETIWMLLAVVVSLGITYRGRVIDVVGQLKTRLYKA